MCNKELLVAYLYEEISASDRAAMDAHVSGCVECRGEVDQLRQTRRHLASWSPPEPQFDFKLLQTPPRPGERWRGFGFVPQWALATAAVLFLLAGSAAVANLEVRYGAEGLVIRTGWGQSAPAAVVSSPASDGPPPAVPARASSQQLEDDLKAIARRLAELEKVRSEEGTRVVADARPGLSAAEIRRILAESESRQRTETALQVAQIWKDFNAVRASDFARVQDVVGRAQGLTNYQLKQHRDSIESLYRVSAQQR